MIGYIRIYRKLKDWEWYHDVNTTRLFLHLLLSANYKDKIWQGVKVEAGSLVTGRLKLAQETTLSQQQIRTCLTKLKSTNEITIKSTRKYSIIKLNNWNDYQESNQRNNQQVTNNQPTSNQQVTTTKERKNIKKKEYICSENFEKFWNEFPSSRKVNKSKCLEVFSKLSDVDQGLALVGIQKYRRYWEQTSTEAKFIPLSTTWLNQQRWNDGVIAELSLLENGGSVEPLNPPVAFSPLPPLRVDQAALERDPYDTDAPAKLNLPPLTKPSHE